MISKTLKQGNDLSKKKLKQGNGYQNFENVRFKLTDLSPKTKNNHNKSFLKSISNNKDSILKSTYAQTSTV